MFKRICLITWHEDVPDDRVERFLEWANDHFSSCPFEGCWQGRAILEDPFPAHVAMGTRAHWMYEVTFRSWADLATWKMHPFHVALAAETSRPEVPHLHSMIASAAVAHVRVGTAIAVPAVPGEHVSPGAGR